MVPQNAVTGNLLRSSDEFFPAPAAIPGAGDSPRTRGGRDVDGLQ